MVLAGFPETKLGEGRAATAGLGQPGSGGAAQHDLLGWRLGDLGFAPGSVVRVGAADRWVDCLVTHGAPRAVGVGDDRGARGPRHASGARRGPDTRRSGPREPNDQRPEAP